jgi:hypothetical protein
LGEGHLKKWVILDNQDPALAHGASMGEYAVD